MEDTDRELALRCWKRKSTKEKIEFAKKAKYNIENVDIEKISNDDIEWIWCYQPYNS